MKVQSAIFDKIDFHLSFMQGLLYTVFTSVE
jgi:hypothetical protein